MLSFDRSENGLRHGAPDHDDNHATSSAVDPIAGDIEHRMHLEFVPGTEVLISSFSTGIVNSEKGTDDGTVLVPLPSEDPHDPLVSSTSSVIAPFRALCMSSQSI